MAKSLLYGVGINDADYYVKPVIGGKRLLCPYYVTWSDMLKRCYSEKLHLKYPTYKDCTACDDWAIFTKFKAWMEQEDWQGKELDKDILCFGNKVYAPEFCVFVDSVTNSFTLNCGAKSGLENVGAYWCKRDSKFRAKCNNPFTGKLESIGRFDSQKEAHNAWKKRKHELALQLAELQTDERVAAALRVRYLQERE